MRIYIAGPMRGYALWNFPAFDRARDLLLELGHEPVSPADIDRANGIDEHTTTLPSGFIHIALRRDYAEIVNCDAIAFLPGWEKSSGANCERRVGLDLGLQFYRLDPDARSFETELIIGLSGYARAGKDTAAELLVERHGFQRAAFADILKSMLFALNPIVTDHGDLRLAEFVSLHGWESAKEIKEVRSLLQRLGTEAGRQILGQNVWIDALFARSTAARLVIPDVRFPNEADAIRARGGYVVRIERGEPVNDHPSETALDDYEFDVRISNFGSLRDLQAQADSLLDSVLLLSDRNDPPSSTTRLSA